MMKKIIICAVIALVLVPATVMAAGYGWQNNGTAPGQGSCLQNGQNCGNASWMSESGVQGQCQYGMQQNGNTRGCITGECPCTQDQKNTRMMSRLRDGSGSRCGMRR